jgi:hypothetical protein
MNDFASQFWYVVGYWIGLTTLPGLVAASFIPIVSIVILALIRADRGADSSFKLVHFFTNDVGRGSYYALGYTVLVIVCAWGLWALIVMDKLTEWYLTIVIGGFVIGALGGTASRTIAKIKGAADPDPAAGDVPDEPAPPAPAYTATKTETVTVPQPDPPTSKPKGKR